MHVPVRLLLAVNIYKFLVWNFEWAQVTQKQPRTWTCQRAFHATAFAEASLEGNGALYRPTATPHLQTLVPACHICETVSRLNPKWPVFFCVTLVKGGSALFNNFLTKYDSCICNLLLFDIWVWWPESCPSSKFQDREPSPVAFQVITDDPLSSVNGTLPYTTRRKEET